MPSLTLMMMAGAMAALGVAVLIALIRAVLGPTVFDRLLIANSIGTMVILAIALNGFIMGRPEFLDIAILYAIINFIGTVALTKLLTTGGLGGR